jgi:plastocyanin
MRALTSMGGTSSRATGVRFSRKNSAKSLLLSEYTREVMLGGGLNDVRTLAFIAPADNERFPGVVSGVQSNCPAAASNEAPVGTPAAASWIGRSAALSREDRPAVSLQVELSAGGADKAIPSTKTKDLSSVVVWLEPLDTRSTEAPAPATQRPKLIQKNKKFEPHLLVVPVGSTVDFPNHDPFFHNVFSVFDGKRFDLGLYEAGATNSVRFDKPGVSYLFCNIHPEMSAVVVVLDTPYYAVSSHTGEVSIPNVPQGPFELHAWYERSLPEDLRHLTRVVQVSTPSENLGVLVIPENPDFTPAHKNKFGQDYAPPPTDTYVHHQ